METKVEVVPVEVDYLCDVVGCKGKFRTDGTALLSSPPQYPHHCTECGLRKVFRCQYPHIKHVAPSWRGMEVK